MTSTSTSRVATAAASTLRQGVDAALHTPTPTASPSRDEGGTSPASIAAGGPAGRGGVALGDRPRRGDRFQRRARGDEDLADLAGAERGARMDHAVDHDGGGEAGADGNEQRAAAPAAAPNVASATRGGAHVVADRDRDDRAARRGARAPGGRATPSSPRASPTPASSTIPGTATPTPATSRPSSEHSSTSPAATAGDVVEHGIRAVLATGGHAAEHVQPGRPEDPGLQRRAADVDGDDGEAVEPAHLSAARVEDDAERQRPRPVGVAAGLAGELDGEALGADEVGHRVEILAHELRSRRGDVVGQATRRLAEHPHDGPRPADADRAVAVLHRRVGLGPEAGGLAALQRRLLGDRRGPAATEERDLANRGRGDRAGRSRPPPSAAAMTPARSSPSEARSRARTEVGKRVCTTDCSAANGRAIDVVADRGDRASTRRR